MKSITINGSKRESVGKKSSRALRNAGEVPCVLYGGDTPVHFSAHESAFTQLVYTSNAHTVVIALNNGETYNAILQDIQFHPVTDAILHVDLYQLFDDKPVSLSIPVQFNGNPKGVKNGGRLLKNQRRLRVKALPANLPDVIEVEIDHLKIGDKLYIHELETNGYSFLHPENTVVGQVRRSRIFIEDIEDEEGVEGAEGTEETEGETPDTDSGETQE